MFYINDMRIALIDLYTNGHHLKYAGELVKFLNKRNHKIALITLNLDERTEQFGKDYPFVKIFATDKKTISASTNYLKELRRQALFFKKAFKIARDFKAETVHLMYIDSILPLYKTLKAKNPFRIVATSFWLAAAVIVDPAAPLLFRIITRINRIAFKRVLKKKFISRVFAQNVYPKFHQQTIEQALKLSEEEKKTFLYLFDPIYEEMHKLSEREESRRKLDLPLNYPIMLFFGEITRGKGLDIFIDAMIKSKKKLCLVIAGRANFLQQSDIDRYKKQLSKNQKIIDRLGFVPNELVADYYISSDAVLMPYRKEYANGTSGVLMEACSAKRPIIAANVGTIGQLVRDYRMGLTFKAESVKSLANAIDRFLSGKSEITRLAQDSTGEYLKIASWKKIAPKIVDAYSK